MTSKIKISGEQRDLLYESLFVHLSGIDAVWLAASQQDFEKADRLGRDFSEELRLVIDDLGWGECRNDELVELTTPPAVIRRVVERVRTVAEAEDAEQKKDRAELHEAERKTQLLRSTCDEILEECARPDSNRRPSA